MSGTREFWPGPVGRIEVLLNPPDAAPVGVLVLAHPHPLLGGTPEHKVPALLAARLSARGWQVARPCFRGVSGTDGLHDHGEGETDDLIAVAARLHAQRQRLPLALVGYSFGAYVQARVHERLLAQGQPVAGLALIGTGIGSVAGGRHYDTPKVPTSTLVIHGERDEQVPLESVLRWAEPQGLPVVIIAGADHGFNRRVTLVADIVVDYAARWTDGTRGSTRTC